MVDFQRPRATSEKKTEALYIRVTPRERGMIRMGASASGKTESEFVMDAVLTNAREVLSEA